MQPTLDPWGQRWARRGEEGLTGRWWPHSNQVSHLASRGQGQPSPEEGFKMILVV